MNRISHIFNILNMNLVNIIFFITIILSLISIPTFSQHQNQNLINVLLDTKMFLRTFNNQKETLKGIILIHPQENKINYFSYNKIINGEIEIVHIPVNELIPNSSFYILKDFDLSTLHITYNNGSTINVLESFPFQNIINFNNINNFNQILIVNNQPCNSGIIDTFKIPQITKIDTIVKKVYRNFSKNMAYFLIPGGGRFYKRKPWQGLGLAILQLAPIPFIVYYDNQHNKYYNKALKAAALGDQHTLNINFDKSQKFHRQTGIAIGISAVATLINIFDVYINIKEITFEPLVTSNGAKLVIRKKLK
jgi:hypothetical protein